MAVFLWCNDKTSPAPDSHAQHTARGNIQWAKAKRGLRRAFWRGSPYGWKGYMGIQPIIKVISWDLM
jgi:hypothetical protein